MPKRILFSKKDNREQPTAKPEDLLSLELDLALRKLSNKVCKDREELRKYIEWVDSDDRLDHAVQKFSEDSQSPISKLYALYILDKLVVQESMIKAASNQQTPDEVLNRYFEKAPYYQQTLSTLSKIKFSDDKNPFYQTWMNKFESYQKMSKSKNLEILKKLDQKMERYQPKHERRSPKRKM